MVIQPNMSPKSIVDVWRETEDVFIRHNVPLTKQALESLVGCEQLSPLLQELNSVVGNSTSTCIEGG